MITFNPYYTFEIDTSGQKIEFDFNVARIKTDMTNELSTTEINGEEIFEGQRNIQIGNTDIFTSKLDYTYPFSKDFKLQIGLKYSDADLDINLAGIFFLLSLFIGSMDYADYPADKKYLLWVDHLNFLLFTPFSVYILVYVIFAKYFPSGKFIHLFFWGILFLFFMGMLEMQWMCYFRTCEDNLFEFKFLYYGFVTHIEGIGIFATFLLGKKLYDAQMRVTKIEKEKKESELLLLKSQIDPHFLFNNLNTIDSLIDRNPKAAKVYLNKLSTLYRYLISNKDLEVVPLEEELEFAKNYMYLIESRFGDAYLFAIKNKLGDGADYLIPLGALQTLLENIVKHNHGNSQSPIKTNINITEDSIIVSNNINAKNKLVESTGIGLSNLKARYQLLSDNKVEIQSNKYFIVKLPSIKQVT